MKNFARFLFIWLCLNSLYGNPLSFAKEIFVPQDHCVAYKTAKQMFLFVDTDVIGKSCEVESSLQRSEDQSKIQFQFQVDVTTFNTDDEERDEHVAEILGAPKHENIYFTSDWFTPQKLREVLQAEKITPLFGQLGINGNSYPIRFDLQITQQSGTQIIEAQWTGKFEDLNVIVPSAGGGLIFEASEDLQLLTHLHLNRIVNQEILNP